jgi:tetratricopeptide (TPR) repeat protein
MSVSQFEQLDCFEDHDESHNRTLLPIAITEAFAFLNAGAPQEAIDRIKQYQELAERSDSGCYIFGLIYFNADHLRHALTWFDRALALRHAFPEALSARAIVLQKLGQPKDALESFEAILILRPHDAETFFNMGVVLQSLGRVADALVAYENALRWSPAHCEALTNRGALLERFGRLEEALACFDAIETIRPGDSANLFNKGSVLQKLGRHEDALVAYEDAGRRGPPDAETELNRGNVLQKLGRLEEALAAYDLCSRYRHGYPQALYNKGIALQGLGRPQEALTVYDAALALDPAYYEASCNRGNVLYELGHLGDALTAFNYTLKIRPGFLLALINRANILLQLGRAEEAILCCAEVLRREPEHPQSLGIRGAALYKLGRLEEALTSLDEAVRFNPAAADAWLNRANVLQELDRCPEAISCYGEALRLKPHYPEALSGLGVALKETGRIDEALAYFDEALKYKSGFPDARNNRAGALLLKGNLQAGFEDFESRWERSNAPPKAFISDLPKWAGENLAGQAIVVWDEQGLGDLIQFSRYLLCLAEIGADVTLLCRKNMHRLLRSLPKPIHIVEAVDPKEHFAFQSALMSLPYGFQSSLDTVPAPVSYLRPEPSLVSKWAGRIGGEGFRIGVGWHGNKFINLQRSIPLSCFAPLAAIDGVRLISLMKDYDTIEMEAAGNRFTIEGLGNDFDSGPDSFVDCAAAMENVDLVVTSDTAIAHLAGALGRPVFLALKHVPDWRWLMQRDDCPWYPAMTLFRQAEKGDWKPVFERIASSVESLVAKQVERTAKPRQREMLAIPSSVGELIDKITILEIKENRIKEAARLDNVRFELKLLRQLKTECGYGGERLAKLEAELKAANKLLWNVEDALREHEARSEFGAGFVSLARKVYTTNDQRAIAKKKINDLFNSIVVEEKSYSTYGSDSRS